MDSLTMLFRIAVSPTKVVKCAGPRLVPFFKATALYFVLYPIETPETVLYCIFKCLPIICLMGFVLSYSSSPEDREIKMKKKNDHQVDGSMQPPLKHSRTPSPSTSKSMGDEDDDRVCFAMSSSSAPPVFSSPVMQTWTNKLCMRMKRLTRGLSAPEARYRRFILLGLAFSCLGDVLLVFKSAGLFVPGMLAFAAAQCCYMLAFGLFEPPRCPLLALACLCMAITIYSYFYPMLESSFLAVVSLLYVLLIFTMLWRAIVRGLFPLHEPSTWTALSSMLGALFFVLSDLTISVHMFCFPVPNSNLIIMGTYYVAQMGIALSMVEGHGLTARFTANRTP